MFFAPLEDFFDSFDKLTLSVSIDKDVVNEFVHASDVGQGVVGP